MKIALITTTINIPTVLSLYRKLGPDVQFFVAGDEKTPSHAAMGSDPPHYMSPHYQRSLNYKSSELIGWNTDSRRNIALLEALKWGADILVSIDDDMVPYGPAFFDQIEFILTTPFSGVQFDAFGWFDAGQFTIPPARQRGLPTTIPHHNREYSLATDVEIGVMQGIILGTPDTDASTTVVNRPFVHSASDVLKNGFVVGLDTRAVFNSQITAFRRELAPAFFQFYKTQARNTDIIASVIMRRLMRDRKLYTYYGPPSGFHARTWRDPFKDMRAEQHGIEIIDELTDWLDSVLPSPDKSVIESLRFIYEYAPPSLFSSEHRECALAFLDDCEGVL